MWIRSTLIALGTVAAVLLPAPVHRCPDPATPASSPITASRLLAAGRGVGAAACGSVTRENGDAPAADRRDDVSGGRAPASDAAVDAMLAAMSTREKVAQMVMPWIPGEMEPGTSEYRRAERWVAADRVGGLIVGKGDRDQTALALAALQRRSTVPLIIASDLEWGAGMRLLGATLLPVAMAVAATGDTALAYAHGRATADEARAAGLHMALAPALDVNVNPKNPIINTRSFGGDPAAVARFGTAAVRGFQDGGLLAVVKHFPGHGDTDQDSHLTLPTIDATRARLDSVELLPFRAAVRAGVGGIMVGHIAVPAITRSRVPASLAPAVMTGLLRDELRFEGLAFTDALNMAGVTRVAAPRELALRAVRAGADVLLQPTDPTGAIDAITAAVERGQVSRARIDASVKRILRAKTRLGLVKGTAPHAAGGAGVPVGTTATASETAIAAERIADSIARRSITLLRDSAGLLPLSPGRPVLSLVYAGTGVPGGPSAALDSTLRAHGVTVERRSLSAGTASRLADSLADAWSRSDTAPVVVVSTYVQAVPWRGALGLPPGVAAAVERLARVAPLVHVALGDPYVVASTPSASTVLLAWSGLPAAQRAAARALAGTAGVSGRLPVAIPPRYRIGDGITR